MDIKSLLRPGLPVPSGFTVSEVPCRAKLDQNEASAPPPDALRERVLDELRAGQWNRYPQPVRYLRVKERFAQAIGQPPERVVLTVGGDQAILLAFWLAGGHNRRARVFEPTYPMFAHCARVTETNLDRIVLDADFKIDRAHLEDRVELLALVRPNNPTGGSPTREEVLRALSHQGIVLLDEAYADFSGDSLSHLVSAHPNLIVARSLSKALLAGVRLGYAIAHPDLVQIMERLLTAPYHLNELQLAVASQMDHVVDSLKRLVPEVTAERERISAALADLGVRSWPSRANFVLFSVGDAGRVFAKLVEAGVRVRDVSSLPGLAQHLRVTVGTRVENDLFLDALREIGAGLD